MHGTYTLAFYCDTSRRNRDIIQGEFKCVVHIAKAGRVCFEVTGILFRGHSIAKYSVGSLRRDNTVYTGLKKSRHIVG